MKEIRYKTNINCGGCIKSVSSFLNELDNVDNWSVDIDHVDKVLLVKLDDDNSQAVVDAVKLAGFAIEEI